MNFILKRDPVWLASLPSHNASPSLLLLGGDGQQVAVPAPLLLAVSPLVRNILTGLLPPAYSPCFFSLPAVTEDILHVMVDILATGAAGGEHRDKIEDVRQVFGMLGVEGSLVSCLVDRRQASPEFDRSFMDEDSSGEIDNPLDENNIIKLEVIVKTDEKNADDKSKATRKSVTVNPQILASRAAKMPCKFCPLEYTNKQNLMRHVRSIHELVKFSCDLCPQKFTQKQDLVRHIKGIHDQIKFTCNLCPQKFNLQNSLVKHIKSVHDQILTSCKLCHKRFIQKKTLDMHIRSVHDQIKFSCQLCPQKFSQKPSLLRHTRSVHEEIKFPCNLCSRKFAQKRNLVKHVKSAHDETK